ncbi:MAG: bifunctional hydroxymethylpyrimidine kinase/phosphomethylpyrimidine kinase, partial [Chloroflexi bacterium]|nr:bifunctional hydroxymethylpyrimidine kinase/phosphomethylpyrimidine kinase [Chloroflexota bacterium]
TPNLPEASVLVGRSVETLEDARQAARDILGMGARSVVVKGGHLQGDAIDVFYDGRELRELSAPRIETTSTHGTGCTFASAIAAGLARGMGVDGAVAQAKEYVTEAIRNAYQIGGGHGPLSHFYMLG